MTLHDYLYGNNNPVVYIDPSGKSVFIEQLKLIGFGSALTGFVSASLVESLCENSFDVTRYLGRISIYGLASFSVVTWLYWPVLEPEFADIAIMLAFPGIPGVLDSIYDILENCIRV